ncbi:unnamed protein product, partial [Ectocarpus sp. 12 AP-2014]
VWCGGSSALYALLGTVGPLNRCSSSSSSSSAWLLWDSRRKVQALRFGKHGPIFGRAFRGSCDGDTAAYSEGARWQEQSGLYNSSDLSVAEHVHKA